MIKLLKKELKLVISPAAYLFPLLSGLLLIPSYPYCVGIIYFIFGIQISFQMAYANRDIEFTSMLPLPRNMIVMSKILAVAFIESLQLLYAIPFAILTSFVINTSGNIVGMDANLAFFGFALIEMTAFNVAFLPNFFKTGYKMGFAFVYGISAMFLTIVLLEGLAGFVPALHSALDGFAADKLIFRIITLLVGLLIYFGGMVFSYKKSVANFNKVNL